MKKILPLLILPLIFIVVLPPAFWVGLAEFLLLPFNILFDIPFFILIPSLFLFVVIALYTLLSKNYQKFNLAYCCILGLLVMGFASIEIEILFSSTAFFKFAECFTLYLILIALLLSVAVLAYIFKRNDTRYYLIFAIVLTVVLLIRFLIFLY